MIAIARRAASQQAWKKKSAGEIMNNLKPMKTGHLYDVAWDKFCQFRDSTAEPNEDQFIQYLSYLRDGCKFKSSTLWNTYAKLNSCCRRKYGKSLQSWPRLKLMLKTYEHGYVRKTASIFTQAQIKQALQIDKNSPKWIMRKAAIAIAYCGGLRGADLRSITVSGVSVEADGVWINYTQSKQKGEVKRNQFVVPFVKISPPPIAGLPAPSEDEVCYGSRVVVYLELLRHCHPNISPDKPLFLRARKNGLGLQPMGANMLGNISREIAEELNLPNPETFTGHGFRRSAATEAASRGATSVNMKGHFG